MIVEYQKLDVIVIILIAYMYTFINMDGFCNSFLFHAIFALIIFIEAKCNLMSIESNKTGLNLALFLFSIFLAF